MTLTNIRTAFDGRIRYQIGFESGVIWVYKYEGVSGNKIPFVDGTFRKQVMTATVADIDYFHNTLVVDNADVGTYYSIDSGETWTAR